MLLQPDVYGCQITRCTVAQMPQEYPAYRPNRRLRIVPSSLEECHAAGCLLERQTHDTQCVLQETLEHVLIIVHLQTLIVVEQSVRATARRILGPRIFHTDPTFSQQALKSILWTKSFLGRNVMMLLVAEVRVLRLACFFAACERSV